MNSLKRSLQLGQLCARHISTTQLRLGRENVPIGYCKLKAKQARFQCDDGKPVWLKGGPLDKVIYQTTVLLSIVGTVLSLYLFVGLCLPRS